MIQRRLVKDETALIPKTVWDLFQRFQAGGYQLYLVGGAVRDILALNPPHDYDLTTDATPEETQSILADLDPYYNNQFGTVGFVDDQTKDLYEITTFRSESSYSDFRRPDVVTWGKSLEEDLTRRDFTINAIVIGPKDDNLKDIYVTDYFDGLGDYEHRLIRAIGDPSKRFQEDALRMMRAIRFAAQLSFSIEPKTLAAISANAPLLEKISQERIRDELLKILASSYPADGIHLLTTSGLMAYIIPEVLNAQKVAQTGHHTLDVYTHMLEALRYCPSTDPLLRLITFLHDIGKPATRKLRCLNCGWVMKAKDLVSQGETSKTTQYQCPNCNRFQTEHEAATFYGHEVVGAKMVKEIFTRLHFPKRDIQKAITLVRWHMFSYDPQMTDAAIRRFIVRVGKDNINDMMLLRVGDRKGGGSKTTSWRLMEFQKRIGEQLFEPMTISDLAINGHDLMEKFDLKPGPQLGKILNTLFQEVLEDSSKNTPSYLQDRAQQLLSQD